LQAGRHQSTSFAHRSQVRLVLGIDGRGCGDDVNFTVGKGVCLGGVGNLAVKFQIVGAKSQVVIDTLQDFLDTLRVYIVTHGGEMLRQGVGQW
jgi:hypothetical protein